MRAHIERDIASQRLALPMAFLLEHNMDTERCLAVARAVVGATLASHSPGLRSRSRNVLSLQQFPPRILPPFVGREPMTNEGHRS